MTVPEGWERAQAYNEGRADKDLECWDNPFSHEQDLALYNYYQDGYSGRPYFNDGES